MSIAVFQIGFKMAFEFQHKLRLLSLLQLDVLVSTLVILLYGFSDGSGLRLCYVMSNLLSHESYLYECSYSTI